MSEQGDYFRPKQSGHEAAEISRMQREVEAENQSIERAMARIEGDPQHLAEFVKKRILPLLTTLNMELEYIKLRKDQSSQDSVANSNFLFKEIKDGLKDFLDNKEG